MACREGGVSSLDVDFFFVIKIGAISSILNKFTVSAPDKN